MIFHVQQLFQSPVEVPFEDFHVLSVGVEICPIIEDENGLSAALSKVAFPQVLSELDYFQVESFHSKVAETEGFVPSQHCQGDQVVRVPGNQLKLINYLCH